MQVFSINCRSSESLFGITARIFNRSTQAVAPDLFKSLDRVVYAGLLHKRKSYGMPGLVFDLISSFLSKRQLRVVANGMSSQEYLVNTGVPQRHILGPMY